jgi:hypothetical protein
MARGSGSSGGSYSYRQWAAAERAAERERERKEKQVAKDRLDAEAAARDAEAAAGTEAVERRAAELGSLLRSSLGRDPRVSFDSLRTSAAIPPLDLGPLATPIPVPQWVEPARPTPLGRIFGGGQRYQVPSEDAKRAFADAQAEYQRREAARQRASRRPALSGPERQTRRSAGQTRTTSTLPRSRQASGHVTGSPSASTCRRCWAGLPTRRGSPPGGTPGTCPSRRCWPWSGSCRPPTSPRAQGIQARQGAQGRRQAAGRVHRGDHSGRGAGAPLTITPTRRLPATPTNTVPALRRRSPPVLQKHLMLTL